MHHTDQVGVSDLFRDVGAILHPGGKFIVEQRNYERLFKERLEIIDNPVVGGIRSSIQTNVRLFFI